MTMSKKNPFDGYEPHGPEWQAYMLKKPKALIVEVATGIADERDILLERVFDTPKPRPWWSRLWAKFTSKP